MTGVDGCRAGWIAIRRGDLVWRLYPTISALWAVHARDAHILIDIPIGLPEVGPRLTEAAARQVLGARRSSVFSVPVRAAVYAESYPAGCAINAQRTGKKFSKQLWNIAPKIREVDALLHTEPSARTVLKESHPEVVFWALNGNVPLLHPKKTEAGYAERLVLLNRLLPDAAQVVEAGLRQFKRAEVARDDLVDALALAAAASIGRLKSLPDHPETDAAGLPMQIVYPEL
ncbi:MAG: DUF429 domain-containing protein [Anaerolineae bacterium]